MTEPLTRTPVRELNKLIRTGQLDCTTLAEDTIAHRKLLDPLLRAFHQLDEEAMLLSAAAADQAFRRSDVALLCGIPMSVKSVIGVEGFRCYAGAAQPLPSHWEREGPVIRHLRDAGALVAGITHAAELAVGGLGVNPHWGTPRNPWDTVNHRAPGGSSSGAAISIWEGACAFALGTDTGGSIRVPASTAGLVGLKVTSDRWPIEGVVPLASRFDTVGVVAHTVDDVQHVFECIDQLYLGSKGREQSPINQLKLEDFRFVRGSDLCWRDLDPGILDAISTALDELLHAGMRCVDDDQNLFDAAAKLRDEGPNTAAIECNKLVETELEALKPHLSLHVKEFLELAESVSPDRYQSRLTQLLHWRKEVERRVGPLDILFTPTVMVTPPTLEQLEDRDVFIRYSDGLLHNTVLASINGLCAITIPVGLDDAGIPVGLQLVAGAFAERTLLRAAMLIERTLGTGIQRLGLPGMVTNP